MPGAKGNKLHARARANYWQPADVPTDHTKPGSCGSPSDIMKAVWAELKKISILSRGSQSFSMYPHVVPQQTLL